jgi:hypothetical protein
MKVIKSGSGYRIVTENSVVIGHYRTYRYAMYRLQILVQEAQMLKRLREEIES